MDQRTINKEQNSTSGLTFIREGEIIWESVKQETITRVAIKDLRIVGEFTTSNGPLTDDWFYVFVSKDNRSEISAYALGMDTVLKELGVIVNEDLTGQLANSATWKTNVLWPSKFRGKELFKITNKEPATNWGRLKSKIGLADQDVELTDDLRHYLS